MPSVAETTIRSVSEYVENVKKRCAEWHLPLGCSPWFRGQSDSRKPPLPSILRGDLPQAEQAIIGRFRALAPMFGQTPERHQLDEWLYFMQHVGVPTRLLDWTEGALIGLYFAVQQEEDGKDPGVWMLHPLEMNCRTLGKAIFPQSDHPAFVNRCNFAYGAFNGAPMDIKWPIAIIPTHVHPRMRSQKGCFTLHGSSVDNFETMAQETDLVSNFFIKFSIPNESAAQILRDLRLLGITHCSLFTDHDGFATEMKRIFSQPMLTNLCPSAESPWE